MHSRTCSLPNATCVEAALQPCFSSSRLLFISFSLLPLLSWPLVQASIATTSCDNSLPPEAGRLANLIMEPYTYRKLHPRLREIRLLKVLPDAPGKPLRVTIQHASLALRRLQTYETISYVWGDPTRSACLTIHSTGFGKKRHIRVPASAVAALQRVRLVDRPRIVWIDAVCINQDDVGERGQQVAIMGQIYSGSIGNLVYPGAVDDDMSARILRNIKTLLADVDNRKDKQETFKNVHRRYFNEGLVSPCEVDVEAAGTLLELPWFR